MPIVEPYVSVGSIRFGMSEEHLVSLAGAPTRTSKNRFGELVFDYPTALVVVSSVGKGVVEVGLGRNSGEVSVSGVAFFSSSDATALERLIEKDGAAYECYGFIVLLNLGITVTGFHDGNELQKALTAFAKGRWDEMKSELRPFAST